MESEPTNDSRFPQPENGSDKLVDYKVKWCSILRSRSSEACYAVIAGVWAVHGGSSEALCNTWALLALSVAFIHLGLTLAVAIALIEMLQRRFRFSQDNSCDWKGQWSKSAEAGSVWPYTQAIQRTGRWFHWAKLILPLLAAAFLIISLWRAG